MARKTVKKKTTAKPTQKSSRVSNFAGLDNSRSYTSLVYGVLTVLILFVVVFLGIKTLSQRDGGNVDDEAMQTEQEVTTSHTVAEGETLFAIAEKYYQNGELWPTIAAANNISNPDVVEQGTKLTIPEAKEAEQITPTTAPTEPTTTPLPTQVEQPVEGRITESTYVVMEGDNLWDIAVRAYGDGYKWVEIARANKLANPDLIYPGNKLILAR